MFTEISCLQVIYFYAFQTSDNECGLCLNNSAREEQPELFLWWGVSSHVAQRPKNAPWGFQNGEVGWGVRLTVDLPKGSVLGMYTGYVTFGCHLRWKTNRYHHISGILCTALRLSPGNTTFSSVHGWRWYLNENKQNTGYVMVSVCFSS